MLEQQQLQEQQQQKQQQQADEYQRRADELAANQMQQPGYDQQQQQQQQQQQDFNNQQQQQQDIFSQQNNTNTSGEMANLGYDAANPNMSNMGWDESGGGNPTTPGGPASMGAPTPYRDDDEDDEYGGPQSVGTVAQNKEEEMREDETIDEYEDRVLNKRAAHLNEFLKNKFRESK